VDTDAAAGDMTYSAERRYAPTPTAPRRARQFVDEFLEFVSGDDLRETADLLTSEVVADAVRQGPSQISLHVEFGGRGLRVEVSDDPGLVANPDTGAFERSTRRQLVAALAGSWGSELDRGRTTTWFELPVSSLHQTH
jgi:hypothetical protein